MRIAVVGTGYVGLVTGTCFADSGNQVTCVDIDVAKIERLGRGEIPIYEPGLAELVERNIARRRLHFTTDLASAVKPADLVFLAVGTPSDDNGAADLSSLWNVVDTLAPHLRPEAIVVIKSTVPVGTNSAVHRRLKERTGRGCHVASNPEFLKEGTALEDCRKPDRVVVGARDEQVSEVLRELYAPFLRTEKPFLVMSPESAETTKYVANALLATKISFINEAANLCEKMGADINDVRRGIGHDARIGFAFLFPGVGYGGSCFPKDTRAILAMGREHDEMMPLMQAVETVNTRQKTILLPKIEAHFRGDLAGKHLAIWGLAFKPRTDDTREAPARVMIDELLARGATLAVHDPEAMPHIRHDYGDKLIYADAPYDALRDADALVIMTEWEEFRNPDFDAMRSLLRGAVVFDGRNVYEPENMIEQGFTYYSIGRQMVKPA